jgi:hypothetical protein
MTVSEWVSTDDDIWTDNDYYIWIPSVSPDGAAMFVCTGVTYQFDAQINTYMFSGLNNIYSYTAKEV